jgi:hypothetical protein
VVQAGGLIAIEEFDESGSDSAAIGHECGFSGRRVTESAAFVGEDAEARGFGLHPAGSRVAAGVQSGAGIGVVFGGAAFEQPALAIGIGCDLRRVSAEVDVDGGDAHGVREREMEVVDAGAEDDGGVMDSARSEKGDAVDDAEGAGEEGIDADVVDAVIGSIEPHVIGRVVEPVWDGHTVDHGHGRGGRVSEGDEEFAIAMSGGAATAEHGFAEGDEFGDRGGRAVLDEGLIEVGAAGSERIGRRSAAEQSAIGVLGRGTALAGEHFGVAHDEFADGCVAATLDQRFLEEWTLHGGRAGVTSRSPFRP